jgi:elongation factor G
MRLEVTVPDEYVGAVIGDVSSRHGEVNKVESEHRVSTVEAHVPLANMFDFADKVRSLSQGRASYTMEPFRYSPAPAEVLQRMLHPEDFY